MAAQASSFVLGDTVIKVAHACIAVVFSLSPPIEVHSSGRELTPSHSSHLCAFACDFAAEVDVAPAQSAVAEPILEECVQRRLREPAVIAIGDPELLVGQRNGYLSRALSKAGLNPGDASGIDPSESTGRKSSSFIREFAWFAARALRPNEPPTVRRMYRYLLADIVRDYPFAARVALDRVIREGHLIMTEEEARPAAIARLVAELTAALCPAAR
jgi:hypothetical protein